MYKFSDYVPNCKNFQFKEFFKNEKAFKEASPAVIKNIIILASALQNLRDYLGVPIHITSAYRDPLHNALVGGKKDSWHIKALALDCWFTGLNYDVCKMIFLKKYFYGVIFYPNKKIVHLDLRYTTPYLSRNFSR